MSNKAKFINKAKQGDYRARRHTLHVCLFSVNNGSWFRNPTPAKPARFAFPLFAGRSPSSRSPRSSAPEVGCSSSSCSSTSPPPPRALYLRSSFSRCAALCWHAGRFSGLASAHYHLRCSNAIAASRAACARCGTRGAPPDASHLAAARAACAAPRYCCSCRGSRPAPRLAPFAPMSRRFAMAPTAAPNCAPFPHPVSPAEL